MRADVAILCALHEHHSLLLRISTSLVQHQSCSLVEYHGQLWALALQGRTGSISYANTCNLIRAFSPNCAFTFGPAALVSAEGEPGTWYTTQRCAGLTTLSDFDLPKVSGELVSTGEKTIPTMCKEAHLLVSADNFVADTRFVESLAERQGRALTLLDMGGYGVSRACTGAGVAWRHFRWVTDRAGDTAVNQFSRNVRDLAKRGDDVVHLLQEVCHEYCVVQ
jgi:hypothetical protein